MDDTHVVFRCKDHRTGTWRTVRLPGVEFLRRFLQHVLPRGFHKVRYFGLWHPSQRDLSSRAWLLLILEKPTDAVRPMKIADLVEALDPLTEPGDQQLLGGPRRKALSILPRKELCHGWRSGTVVEEKFIGHGGC